MCFGFQLPDDEGVVLEYTPTAYNKVRFFVKYKLFDHILQSAMLFLDLQGMAPSTALWNPFGKVNHVQNPIFLACDSKKPII